MLIKVYTQSPKRPALDIYTIHDSDGIVIGANRYTGRYSHIHLWHWKLHIDRPCRDCMHPGAIWAILNPLYIRFLNLAIERIA